MRSAPGVWIGGSGAILMLARDRAVLEADGCSFDGGAGFLRSTVTLVNWALALILYTYVIGGGYPGGTSLRTTCIPTACYMPLAILCISFSVSLQPLRRATTLKTQSMDLLVAGLRGIEPYGLYQYDSLVDRKERHSICCTHS